METKITTELVKELRDRTGVSIMQCRNALIEAGGDIERALIVLKKKSSSIAMKKADRDATDGVVIVLEENGKALLLTLHSETDFVARNSNFIDLANKLAKIAMSEGIEMMKSESENIINPVIQKLGEKIELGHVEEITGLILGFYVHGGKSAAVVSLNSGTPLLAKDMAMHVTAMQPEDIAELLDQPFIKNPDVTVGKLLAESGVTLIRFIRESIK